jgi:hypothetical protein
MRQLCEQQLLAAAALERVEGAVHVEADRVVAAAGRQLGLQVPEQWCWVVSRELGGGAVSKGVDGADDLEAALHCTAGQDQRAGGGGGDLGEKAGVDGGQDDFLVGEGPVVMDLPGGCVGEWACEGPVRETGINLVSACRTVNTARSQCSACTKPAKHQLACRRICFVLSSARSLHTCVWQSCRMYRVVHQSAAEVLWQANQNAPWFRGGLIEGLLNEAVLWSSSGRAPVSPYRRYRGKSCNAEELDSMADAAQRGRKADAAQWARLRMEQLKMVQAGVDRGYNTWMSANE